MTAAILEDAARDTALKAWIAEITAGGRVAAVEHVSGGAFRLSARVQIEGGDHDEIFLKIDLGSAPPTGYDLVREYDLLRRLDGMAVRAPQVLGFDAELATMAMACLPGDARYATIGDDAAWRARIERSFVEALVEVHRLDVAALGLAHIPPGLTTGQAIVADLAAWRALLFEGVAAPDAVTLFAFAWLAARVPGSDRAAVLVQGDAGPGNFLFDATGVTGLVDWEMAHLGHPLEDIGCVLARSLVQPMIEADRLIALYEAASGTRYTRQELIYATILLMTRFNVPILLALESRTTALDYGLTSSYFRLSQISMLTLIAEAEGIPVDLSTVPPGFVPDIGFELEYLGAMLRDVIRPRLPDDYGRYRTDGAIALVDYLRNVVDAGREAADVEDPGTRLQAYAAIVAGGRDGIAATLVELLDAARHRETLMAGMLGPLSGRRVKI